MLGHPKDGNGSDLLQLASAIQTLQRNGHLISANADSGVHNFNTLEVPTVSKSLKIRNESYLG
jgi:hypothetical protein